MNVTANPNIVVALDNELSLSDDCKKLDSSPVLDKKHLSSPKKRERQSYLSTDVMLRMIDELLCNKKISFVKLVGVLGIDKKDLDDFILQRKLNKELMAKINLPLIELYCGTKFEKK